MIKLSTFKKITRSKSLAKTRPVNYSTIRTKILISSDKLLRKRDKEGSLFQRVKTFKEDKPNSA